MIPKWYKKLHHPKMHTHTKFGIPSSKNIGYAPDSMQILETRSRSQAIRDTPQSQDTSTHQIWDSHLK